ncbi:MAG: HEAT repeat domain-containing protein [Candidatus Limnocylindrales bacterium]
MSRIDDYRRALVGLTDPEPFALAESGLPGPRGNLELIAALAEVTPEATLRRWAALSPAEAPGDQPPLVLAVAGIVGLGRLLDRDPRILDLLHGLAGDPRWRVREGVAMALQAAGMADPGGLVERLRSWVSDPDPFVRRAVVAGLCEPALLRDASVAARVVAVLDALTASLVGLAERRTEPGRVLRQALGYGWSVAIIGAPAAGKAAFGRWLASPDPDIRWVVRENLGKARLTALDRSWVADCRARLSAAMDGD